MSATPGRVYINSTYTVVGMWQDNDGTYLDPDTVLLKVTDPTGTQTTYTYPDDDEIERRETGIYHGDIPVGEYSGRYYWRWEGTNTSGVTVRAPTEGSFVVQASKWEPDTSSNSYR